MSDTIYRQLAERIFLKDSKLIPELFAMIADREEAGFLLAMPGTAGDLAQKLGTSAEKGEKVCATLYHKGLAFKSLKEGTVSYKMCRDIVQFHDASILWAEAPREYHDLWQRYMEEEFPAFAKMVEKLLPKPFSRVIPVHEAVEAGRQRVLDIDSANKIVESADVMAVTRCTCRVITHKCDNPVEVCLQVGNAARYTIDRGSGREVTKKEALDILAEAERRGLVHVTINKAYAGHFICNCCSCCCQSLPLFISQGIKLTDPSRFRARIDAGRCTGCLNCLERCHFNALEEAGDAVRVKEDRCLGCGLCYSACPEEAISMEEVRPEEFVPA